MELPSKIGSLTNLEVLDLEGTDLICLPEEIEELGQLKCLKVSLYKCAYSYMGKRKGIQAIIPRGALSKLSHLKELSINVDPDCEWWDVVYVNGEGNTVGIGKALEHAKALLLDRHWTIEKLSEFQIHEMHLLLRCLIVDCNEMDTIIDRSDFYQGGDKDNDKKPVLELLHYLSIHHTKNLRCIWKGPIVKGSLSSLQILALYLCPKLITTFNPVLLRNLVNLKDLIVKNCPMIASPVTVEPHPMQSENETVEPYPLQSDNEILEPYPLQFDENFPPTYRIYYLCTYLDCSAFLVV
ncbi:hypothetical protein LguiB_006222 [Lonicera macranthoides]